MRKFFKREDIVKNMEIFGRELERLHKLMLARDVGYDLDKGQIAIDIKEIHDHMLTVSKRIAGLEY